MKGLRKYLAPFTPDQSGAVSVLFGYGGMLIIMDAGGCVGNICGYDEPRWTKGKSAIFSAGLRDLDAILGRDELLIEKTRDALNDIDAKFVGLIGTPVPATIATDYRALKRLMENDYGMPVLAIETNGMDLYDKGQEKAYLKLFEEYTPVKNMFVKSTSTEDAKKAADVAIIGATPLDCISLDYGEDFQKILGARGHEQVICYGVGDSLEDLRLAGEVETNLVVSTSGLEAARWLAREYGTPYEVGYPIGHRYIRQFAEKVTAYESKRILIVHQQVFANEIRKIVYAFSDQEPERLDVASWFRMDEEISMRGDSSLVEEDDLLKLVEENRYDMVIGDPLFKRALPGWDGIFLDLPHFAVSAELHDSPDAASYWAKAGERRW